MYVTMLLLNVICHVRKQDEVIKRYEYERKASINLQFTPTRMSGR